jgi:Cu/Ag efflux protein CusF
LPLAALHSFLQFCAIRLFATEQCAAGALFAPHNPLIPVQTRGWYSRASALTVSATGVRGFSKREERDMVRLPKLLVVVFALAFLLALAAPSFADVTQGKIKSVTADKKEFVFTDKDGKDWTMVVADDARIRLADKDLKLNDLKAGEEVAIIYEKKGDKLMAHAVSNGDVTRGKVKSASADTKEVVFTDKDGKDWTLTLADGARIRLSDKDAKVTDLKAGDQVDIIYEKKGDKLIAKEICSEKK